jgi:hypothetical protein
MGKQLERLGCIASFDNLNDSMSNFHGPVNQGSPMAAASPDQRQPRPAFSQFGQNQSGAGI